MWMLNFISQLLSLESITLLVLLLVLHHLYKIGKHLEKISSADRPKVEIPNDRSQANHKSENDKHSEAKQPTPPKPNPTEQTPTNLHTPKSVAFVSDSDSPYMPKN
jgi:hypothetical protein